MSRSPDSLLTNRITSVRNCSRIIYQPMNDKDEFVDRKTVSDKSTCMFTATKRLKSCMVKTKLKVKKREKLKADEGLSTGAIVGIAVGCGCLLAIAIVVLCVITSRSKRKKEFRHTFSETNKRKKGATITSLSRFSQKIEKRPDTVYSDIEAGCSQLQVNLKNSVYNEATTVPFTQRVPSKQWESPETNFLGPSVTEDYKRGQRSSALLRQGIPGTHLARNISTKIPTRCRTNSNCSSVVSYDLGNPRNSSAVTRQSSLFFPHQTHRHRTDTIETARSSGLAMDLGDEMNKAWMLLDNDYSSKHRISHL